MHDFVLSMAICHTVVPERDPLDETKIHYQASSPGIITHKIIFLICLTSLTRAKCGIPSTLCWKIPNISGSIELFAL